MDLRLAGRTALVTGSSSGIGAGIARMLADEGARVVIHGRNSERARAVAEEIGAAGTATGDLSNCASADEVADAARQAVGGEIDILVNNSGGAGESSRMNWLDVTEDMWMERYQANTIAAVRMIRRLVPGMIKQRWGRVIQISSVAATQPGMLGPDYSSAKAAMQTMTVSLARSLADTGVTANTISPGVVLTPAIVDFANAIGPDEGWGSSLSEEEISVHMGRDRHKLPVGRIGRVEDVGQAVCMLCSPEGGYITGANMRVDGGQLLTVN